MTQLWLKTTAMGPEAMGRNPWNGESKWILFPLLFLDILSQQQQTKQRSHFSRRANQNYKHLGAQCPVLPAWALHWLLCNGKHLRLLWVIRLIVSFWQQKVVPEVASWSWWLHKCLPLMSPRCRRHPVHRKIRGMHLRPQNCWPRCQGCSQWTWTLLPGWTLGQSVSNQQVLPVSRSQGWEGDTGIWVN